LSAFEREVNSVVGNNFCAREWSALAFELNKSALVGISSAAVVVRGRQNATQLFCVRRAQLRDRRAYIIMLNRCT
jgi:hypothetical protein